MKMNVLDFSKWVMLLNIVNDQMIENTMFTELNLTPKKDMSVMDVIDIIEDYKSKNENIILGSTSSYDIIDLYKMLNIGVMKISRSEAQKLTENEFDNQTPFGNHEDKMSDEEIEKLKAYINIELNYENVFNAIKFISEKSKEKGEILNRILDNVDTEEDAKVFEKELKYQSVVLSEHPFFVKPEDGELTFEIFKERYKDFNNPQPTVTTYKNEDEEAETKNCCGNCSGDCDK